VRKNFIKNLLLICYIIINCSTVLAEAKVVRIGSGHITGIYYPVAQQLCKIIEQESHNNYKCIAVPTKGTLENLTLLNNNEIDFVIAQSDISNDAFLGQGIYNGQKQITSLRRVVGLFNESLTILVRKHGKINVIDDLKGKKILASTKNSIFSFPLTLFVNFYNWQEAEYPIFINNNLLSASNALCEGIVDAVAITISHPNGFTNEIAQKCEIDIISLENPLRYSIINKRPYYYDTEIKGNQYPGIYHVKSTISTAAILVTTKDHMADIVNMLLNRLIKKQNSTDMIFTSLHSLELNISLEQENALPLHNESQRLLEEFKYK
jgi:TRAP transporter TAXI family solute receptor